MHTYKLTEIHLKIYKLKMSRNNWQWISTEKLNIIVQCKNRG